MTARTVAPSRIAFGHGASLVSTLGFIFIAMVLGILNRSIFYLKKGEFSCLKAFGLSILANQIHIE